MNTKNILRAFLTAVFVLGTLAMNAQTKIYVHKSDGTASEYNIADLDSISFTPPAEVEPVVSFLRLNEVNGTDMFYELINIGEESINLAGYSIDYNANGNTNGVFPPNGNQGVTWIGCAEHTIAPGGFFMIRERNQNHTPNINECVTTMRTGLTAGRILIITLKDPAGNVIDQCIRAMDTGIYVIGDKSFSRIPDGTGPFYFTTPTPNATNGDSGEGLLLVPVMPE